MAEVDIFTTILPTLVAMGFSALLFAVRKTSAMSETGITSGIRVENLKSEVERMKDDWEKGMLRMEETFDRAVNRMEETVNKRIDSLASDFALLRTSVSQNMTRISVLEYRADALESKDRADERAKEKERERLKYEKERRNGGDKAPV